MGCILRNSSLVPFLFCTLMMLNLGKRQTVLMLVFIDLLDFGKIV
jgi:hypothetical protein